MGRNKPSERTLSCGRRKWIFTILHYLALFGPFLYFIPYCFVTGEIASKMVIGLVAVVAIILAGVSVIMDVKHRAGLHKSAFWALIAGCTYVLESVTPFVILMAAISIVDELVFVRAKDYYASAQLANREIDRRGS